MRKRTIILILCSLLLLGLGGIYFYQRGKILPGPPKYSLHEYRLFQKQLRHQRDSLADLYRLAKTEKSRKSVLKETGKIFTAALTERFFPAWYGTRWKYTGTTSTPGKGCIACGYFVTTLLRDAGVELNRKRLSISASEVLVTSLCSESNITRYGSYTMEEFEQAVISEGDGLYLTGLDHHTGFLLCEEGKLYFIHARPWCVIRQPPAATRFVKKSKYRILGKISADAFFLKHWLEGG